MTSEVIVSAPGSWLLARIDQPKEDVMSVFLRRALVVDALASGLTGGLMLAGASTLAPMLGLPTALLQSAGLVLIPYVAFVALVASRASISPPAVWAVIACNAAWTLASIALLVDFVTPTALGTVFVIGQALAVAALGGLQYVALHRPQVSLP
jgi:hypothetical protein